MNEIATKLAEIIKRVFDVEITPELTVAPEEAKADYATNVAMQMAGRLKQNPREIATKIVENWDDEDFEVQIAGPGFLNFISSDGYWKRVLGDFGTNFSKNISCDEYFGQKVVCEFSDPNPFKVLHIGHLYTSMVGDAIARLVKFAGGEVIRANFGGDVGLHVAKTLWALGQIKNEDLTIEKIAECYVKGTQAYEENETAQAEIVKLNKLIYQIAERGEDYEWNGEEQAVAQTYWQGRRLSYQYFEDFYDRIGVKFDKYYPESTVAKRGLAEVKNGLAKGVYEESDGAVIFAGEKYDLHTRVFINKEGLPTYEAKDVGLIYTKWDDYHFDKSIVITGNDIIEYMKVVLKSVELMNPELPARTLHLTHGNVKLPGGVKMSSRKGNFVKAVEVLDAVNEALLEERGEENEAIALSAIKYAFLKYKIGGDIDFDIKASVSMTGNSGPYLLYSAVRAQKVLDKVLATEVNSDDWVLSEHEKSLIRGVLEYPAVLREAVKELTPHKIAGYLYGLAQEFSRFYENVQVAGSEFEFERAKIVEAYLMVMKHGLNLLGMEIPERM